MNEKERKSGHLIGTQNFRDKVCRLAVEANLETEVHLTWRANLSIRKPLEKISNGCKHIEPSPREKGRKKETQFALRSIRLGKVLHWTPKNIRSGAQPATIRSSDIFPMVKASRVSTNTEKNTNLQK